MTESVPRPLEGVKVIDLTTVLMGPFATQLLGDMGSDVIKVEAPGGDNVRHIGPSRNAGMGAIFLNVNRSKRSVVLDLKQESARDALFRLCKDADILVFNIRPQAMDRLGLGYDTVSSANPRLIYTGLVGYDPRGPYASRPAYDDLIQGAIGLPSLTKQAGSDEPRYVPLTIADYFAGLTGLTAILGALYWRERSGLGQQLTIPMFETLTQLLLAVHMGGRTFEPQSGPPGYQRLLTPYRRPYKTRDGYVCALIYNDKQCEAFFSAMGRPDLFANDPRFSNISSRTKHIGELYALVEELIGGRTTDECLKLLSNADIPVMPLHDLDSLIDDKHLAAVGLIDTITHPSEGALRSINVPSTWSRTQPRPLRPVPRLGEHSAEVLREIGFSDDEIAAMARSGATECLASTPLPEA
jgi:crotonobetainyl-CoA:carnitine CoA-transferase CaiB-like acyl-CoA transferase